MRVIKKAPEKPQAPRELRYTLFTIKSDPHRECEVIHFEHDDMRSLDAIRQVGREFRNVLDTLIYPRVVVNLKEVQAAPSTFLATLLQFAVDAGKQDVQVRFCRMSRELKRIFDILNAKQAAAYFPSLKAALVVPWEGRGREPVAHASGLSRWWPLGETEYGRGRIPAMTSVVYALPFIDSARATAASVISGKSLQPRRLPDSAMMQARQEKLCTGARKHSGQSRRHFFRRESGKNPNRLAKQAACWFERPIRRCRRSGTK